MGRGGGRPLSFTKRIEGDRSLFAEAAALEAFGPARAVEVLAVRPRERSTEKQASEAAGISSAEPGTVRRIRAAVSADVLDRARKILLELEADAVPDRILHGDLHWDATSRSSAPGDPL